MSDPWTRKATGLAGIVTLLLLLVWFLSATARAEADPRLFLERFGRQSTALLSDSSLSQSGRDQAFGALLGRFFDVPRIGRFVLGKHWHRTSDQEQSEYRQLFERYLVAAYERRLRDYSDLGFTVGSARALGKAVLVDSVIRHSGGVPVSVTWRLHHGVDGWRIIDLMVEGISMAITQRSEFDAMIRNNNGSIRALLDRMRDVVAFDDVDGVGTVDRASMSCSNQGLSLDHTEL